MSLFSTNWKQLQQELKQRNEQQEINKRTNADSVIRYRKRKAEITEIEIKQRSKEGKKVNNNISHFNCNDDTNSGELHEPTKAIAFDCEYVGVGIEGKDNMLARISIVNMYGHCIYDKYVKPVEKIIDYRTAISGIRPSSLRNAEPFQKVQLEVHKLLTNRIVVGHSLKNDFKVLNLSHPRKLIRDTANYVPFRKALQIVKTPSLKLLAKKLLGIDIQSGEHDSITDARVAMKLYIMHRNRWENDIHR